jgi:hypothetical protein
MSSKDLSERDKLRILLPHWLEHNKSHSGEFGRWAEAMRQSGEQEAAALLDKAVKELQDADQALTEAMELLGGSLTDAGHHHH